VCNVQAKFAPPKDHLDFTDYHISWGWREKKGGGEEGKVGSSRQTSKERGRKDPVCLRAIIFIYRRCRCFLKKEKTGEEKERERFTFCQGARLFPAFFIFRR